MNQHRFADIFCNQASSQRHTLRRAAPRHPAVHPGCLRALPADEVRQASIYDKSQ